MSGIIEAERSLNIALLPDQSISQLAIAKSRQLGERFPTHFTLGRKRNLPHATIYQACYPGKNVNALIKALEEYSAKTKAFSLKTGQFEVKFDTFFWWNLVKTPGFQKLHDDITGIANPLREGLVLPSLRTVTGLSEEDRYDMEQFGALLVGPRFAPHVTLTRLVDAEDTVRARNLLQEAPGLDFEVNRLILGEAGDNGTLKNVIQTFALQR